MSALIVTADFGADDFAWLEGLRRAHYPFDSNRVPVHLTLFHALPPSSEDEARRQLSLHARTLAPRAAIAGLMDLGGGVAFRVVSDELDAIRDDIADHFHGMLSAQDARGWRPHITVQNKVPPELARALIAELEQGFRPRSLSIAGLSLHRYLGGPWETLASWKFRG
ncbi:MAG TPA: 2'-5' RNA ligase family protein [Sphingomicrobium sp.]